MGARRIQVARPRKLVLVSLPLLLLLSLHGLPLARPGPAAPAEVPPPSVRFFGAEDELASGPGRGDGDEGADTLDVVREVSNTSLTLRLEGVDLRVPYYGNRSLEGTYPGITRAILVVHGTLRNAVDYYRSVLEAAVLAGGADATTMIIAPQFLTEADVDQHQLPSDMLYWAYMGWRQGDLSLSTLDHPRPARISSFSVADTILFRMASHLPNLQQIVVAGHSAGGQLTNRFTAGNRIHQVLAGTFGVPVRYIVSNPSSYLYFNEERWVEGTGYQFRVPPDSVIAKCPTYNYYKYGLLHPNEYMSLGDQVLREQYSSRRVVYLLGGNDTNPEDFYLDKTCPAMLEGRQRLQRGIVYHHHLIQVFGPEIEELQPVAIVPGVGHDQQGMFTSECGLYYLFDYGVCHGDPPPPVWEDVTTALLRANSAHAVAWCDYDGDGRPDLYLTSTGGNNLLIHNDGDGLFSDATVDSLPGSGVGMCSQWADYDNDGRPDLYLVNWRQHNHLFRNEGNGAFADSTRGPLGATGDLCHASWGDYDNDGDVDLFLTRTNSATNLLLRNDGPAGFVDATAPPLDARGNNRCGVWGDYDNDGDPDLFVARYGASKLFRNDGQEGFVDATAGPLGDIGDCYSAAWGDYDNDGDLDLFIVNRASPDRLLRNDGDGVFSDVTAGPLGVWSVGRSACWGDYDNDGYLDLYVSNANGPNKLLHNEGEGVFTDATVYPLDDSGQSYSSAWADFDGDGALDLYIANDNGPNKLLHNLSANDYHWLHLSLVGVESNGQGIGARVRLVADRRSQFREVGGGSGFFSQNDPTVAFGLGTATIVDTVEIRWPSGIRQLLLGVGANQRLAVVESDQPLNVDRVSGAAASGFRCSPNPFALRCVLTYDLPRPGPVTIEVFDLGGRSVRVLAGGRPEPAGRRSWTWNGTDDSGRKVASGVYLFRLGTGRHTETSRGLLIR